MNDTISTLKTKLETAKVNIAVADEKMTGILQEAKDLGIQGITPDNALEKLEAEVRDIEAKMTAEQQRMDKAITEAEMLLAGSR